MVKPPSKPRHTSRRSKTIRQSKAALLLAGVVTDCYANVGNCPECARNYIKVRQNVGELTLFPTNAPLGSVCIDILGKFVLTTRGNQYLLVIFDRYPSQTNGQVERLNRTIGSSLRVYIGDHPRYWDFYTSTITYG